MDSNINTDEVNVNTIKTDMDERNDMLTNEEVFELAQKVNKKVNLPILNEKQELVVFCKLIRLIDRALYKHLPNEYYELIHNSADGISEADADLMLRRLVPLINKEVNIPFLSESTEKFIINLILKEILYAMVKGNKLPSM